MNSDEALNPLPLTSKYLVHICSCLYILNLVWCLEIGRGDWLMASSQEKGTIHLFELSSSTTRKSKARIKLPKRFHENVSFFCSFSPNYPCDIFKHNGAISEPQLHLPPIFRYTNPKSTKPLPVFFFRDEISLRNSHE